MRRESQQHFQPRFVTPEDSLHPCPKCNLTYSLFLEFTSPHISLSQEEKPGMKHKSPVIPFHDKKNTEQGTQGNLLNLIKDIYENPTATGHLGGSVG